MFQVNDIPEYDQNQDTNGPVNVINVSMVSPLGHQASVSKWMLHLTVYFWDLKPLTDHLNQDYQTWCR